MAKETEKAAWGGAFDAFGKMWAAVRANPEPAALLTGTYLVLTIIEIYVLGLDSNNFGDSITLLGIESVFFLIFLLALPTYALALAKGKKISIQEFLRFDAKKYIAILAGSILYSLAVIGSLLLLIIPAIWVIAWFALYQMAIIDKSLGSVAALKESKRLISGQIGKVWGIIGVTILLSVGFSLLAYVPLIGDLLVSAASVVVALLSTAAVALLYRWAK